MILGLVSFKIWQYQYERIVLIQVESNLIKEKKQKVALLISNVQGDYWNTDILCVTIE